MNSNANVMDQISKQLSDGIDDAVVKLDTPDVAKWIEKEFLIPETRNDPKLRGRMILQPYQRDAIREALRRDEKGNFVYSLIVWSDIKKSAKSTIAAAVNLFRAEHIEWGEFYIVANDLKQADSRVAHYLRRAVQLNPKLTKKYSMRGYRTTSPNGSFLEAIPIDPSGEAGSNADMITFCLDEKTEVLTRSGWKGWKELSATDYVATRSPHGAFEWQQPDSIYCNVYRGEMVRVNHRSMSALVTPDHRMYGKFTGGRGIATGVNGNWSHEFVSKLDNRFLPAKDAMRTKGYYPVTNSAWKGGKSFNFIIPATYGKPSGKMIQAERRIPSRIFAEFMGWYLSEGCVIRKKKGIDGFCIGQSSTVNPKKRQVILDLLGRMGFTPHEWKGGMNIAVYHSEFGKYLAGFGLSDSKYIPDEIMNLPVDELRIFLDAFVEGDGCTNSVGGIHIATRSKQLRDDLTQVAQKCGYSMSDYETTDMRWEKKPVMYTVYLRSPDAGRKITKIEKRNWNTEDYSGVVFCPSTENGVIYVRREGTYYWTGNSELWGANEGAKQTMWTEMTLSPTKHGQSFRWVESYAGFAEESLLLYSLYDLGVKRGRMLWPDKLYDVTDGVPTPLELYVNEEARMLCLWNTQPRCPWQTKEYYNAERAILPSNQFDRVHRNQWVTSSETFVPMEWWDACLRTDAEWPQFEDPEQANDAIGRRFAKKTWPMIVALDAATSNDNFGIFMGCRHPRQSDSILVMYARKWKPVNGKIDFQGTEEKPGPERVLRQLIRDYNVVQVTYDPYQLHDMASRLKQEGLAWFKEFNQGQLRQMADSQFRDLIRDRRLWHRGEVDLREHVQNANADLGTQDSKIRLVKRVDNMKIDLAVAASMCCHNLLYLNL